MCAQCPNKGDATKSLATLAVSSFTIPGDSGFPLNAFLAKPASRAEAGECSKLTPTCIICQTDTMHCVTGTVSADQMRAYFTQLRQELGGRLVEKVFGGEAKPSKVCMHFLLYLLVQELFLSVSVFIYKLQQTVLFSYFAPVDAT